MGDENRLTTEDIIKRVENEVDDILEEDMVMDWIDEALSQIAVFWGEPATTDIDATGQKGEWLDLPSDFIKEAEVYDQDGKRCHSHTINSVGQIMFKVERNYTINYHKKPAPIDREDKSKDLPINPMFHPSVVLWCKAEYWDFESDSDQVESQHANKFRELFYQTVREIARILAEEQVRLPRQKRRLYRRLGRIEGLPLEARFGLGTTQGPTRTPEGR